MNARNWLQRIHDLPLSRLDKPLRIMNVCGGHERTITEAGLRGVLPSEIELIPGPGCPVCVCPEEAVYRAIRLATEGGCRVVSFGDMLHVPVNAPKSEPRSLEMARPQARERGGDIQPIASPQEAVAVAHRHPDQPVVFFVAGFETTIAPIAGLIEAGLPDNLFLQMAARRTRPVVAMLLEKHDAASFDALIAPGHVASIMGADEWRFVVEKHGLPAAVAGFTPESILAAIHSVLRQQLDSAPELANCYPQVVSAEGNRRAQQLLEKHFTIADAPWRGIGSLPDSGFELASRHEAHNADKVLSLEERDYPRAGQMPPGCACAEVVLGQIRPHECPLYGKGCQPRNPVGPCMVSDEGACRIWWSAGIGRAAA